MSRSRTREQISTVMSSIRSRNTKPELVVRSLAHRLGYRFRLHDRSLPGTPDLVFRKMRKVIFVHGCWWHRHDCPLGNKSPRSNTDYWQPKLKRNVDRDAKAIASIRCLGWEALVIWECETVDSAALAARITSFLRRER